MPRGLRTFQKIWTDLVQGTQCDRAPCKSSSNTRWGLSGEVRGLEAYLRVLGCLHFVKPDLISDFSFIPFCSISIIDQIYDSIDQ